MLISAKYENEYCLLNTDYIVDIFPKENSYIAYVLDSDRSGYEISKEAFNTMLENMNK